MSENTAALAPIPLPYNLKHDELEIDPAAEGTTMDEAMRWIVDEISWNDEETMERVFRAMIVLYHAQQGSRTLGECLETAIVWERG
jgi:hypothetical protein